MAFCSECGKEINDKAVVCIHCGVATKNHAVQQQPTINIVNTNTNTNTVTANSGGGYAQGSAPFAQLKTNRGLLKLVLLTIITFGIYMFVFYYSIGEEINIIARKYDGKKTMNFALLVFLITPITFGIALIVWFHKLSDRIGGELARRGISYPFSAGTFWLWNVLGGIIVIGPFVYLSKLATAMNMLAGHYNAHG